MKTVIDNLKINFIKKGIGKSVLILPGWGTTIDTYKTLINAISKYACVYCLDMPGFGQSDQPFNSWNIDDYISFVIKFIKNQNIKELDLIGHSNGGRIIIKLIGNKKIDFKVNKVILIGSAGIVHKKNLLFKYRLKVFKFLKKILGFKPIKFLFSNLLLELKNHFGSEDYRNASPIMKETLVKLINVDLTEYLQNINTPTLLIWGELDTATPISDGEIMEKLIPDAGLVRIQNCSHFVFLEKPAYINKIIYTFLNGEI